MNNTLVYIKEYPFATDNTLNNKQRQLEIEKCLDKKTKEQKFYSYKLLEQAIFENFGIIPTEKDLYKKDDKWVFDKCYVSISHTDNAVAVALSNSNIGVDIELYNPTRFIKLESRIVGSSDVIGDNKGEELNKLWTKKEAVFKLGNAKVFSGSKIDVTGFNVTTKKILLNKTYYLSVAQENSSQVKIIIK